MRIAILASHPIQYYAPLFRRLACDADIQVFYAHQPAPSEQGSAGFGTDFDWDVDLLSGYSHTFLHNVACDPGVHHFSGCDTPDVASVLRDGHFDALLVMGWHLKFYVQGVLGAKRLGLPVMVRGDSHLQTPRSGLKKILKDFTYPVLLRQFDAALYVGSGSRKYYEHYKYPTDRLVASPHCVDTEWFRVRSGSDAREQLRRRLGISPGTPVVLFAGKLLPFKRPYDMIDAAAACRRDGLAVECLIAGDGSLRDALVARAAASGVPLHMLGFCNQTEMPAAYTAADCLVLPSDGNETWGLVANEALACGTPIIVSDACGCHPDLTGLNRAGRSFAVGDISSLAGVIADLFRAPPIAAALASLSETHSLDAAAKGVLAAAHKIILLRSQATGAPAGPFS